MKDFITLAKERFSVRNFKDTEIPEDIIKKILLAGKVAPSAKNMQPLKVYVVKSKEGIQKMNAECRCIYGAPVVLIVAYDTERAFLSSEHEFGIIDASIACTHMMLEAWDLGIGSCWVGLFSEKTIKETFNLGETEKVVALLPIGYKAEDSVPSERHETYRNDDILFDVR